MSGVPARGIPIVRRASACVHDVFAGGSRGAQEACACSIRFRVSTGSAVSPTAGFVSGPTHRRGTVRSCRPGWSHGRYAGVRVRCPSSSSGRLFCASRGEPWLRARGRQEDARASREGRRCVGMRPCSRDGETPAGNGSLLPLRPRGDRGGGSPKSHWASGLGRKKTSLGTVFLEEAVEPEERWILCGRPVRPSSAS